MDSSALQKMVVATGNAKKLREIREILAAGKATREFVPQSEFGLPEAVEDGLSFVENAIIKARHAARLTHLPALADDSGLVVDALNGEPGIYSARYAGEHAKDQDNVDKLLRKLETCGVPNSPARFVCVMVYLRNADDPTPLIAEGEWVGRITDTPAGDNGFGYDPVFFVPEKACTAAQLSSDMKHAISHRGKALRTLAAMLDEMA